MCLLTFWLNISMPFGATSLKIVSLYATESLQLFSAMHFYVKVFIREAGVLFCQASSSCLSSQHPVMFVWVLWVPQAEVVQLLGEKRALFINGTLLCRAGWRDNQQRHLTQAGLTLFNHTFSYFMHIFPNSEYLLQSAGAYQSMASHLQYMWCVL